MTRPGLVLMLSSLLACGDDGGASVGTTPPPPATTYATGPAQTSDDGTTAALPCDCAQGQYCGAFYVPGDPPPDPDAFVCLDECIPADAPGYWCLDDASCCAASGTDIVTCRTDGLCRRPPAETSTTDASTTDASTTDASTTDASTTGASSTGGSSTGGSSTGGSSTGGSST